MARVAQARRWVGGLIPLLVLTGCPYISRSVFEDKRADLDEDLDGSPWSLDCDDLDPTRSPNQPEVPYDGIDNDCGLDGDEIDIDGDTYPGILAEDYPGDDYPDRFVDKPLDCADDPAVVPQAAQIYPGNDGQDAPYDGLDSNCDRSNDFDVDADGWMPTTAPVAGVAVDVSQAFDDYVALWQITPAEVDAWIAASGTTLGDPLLFQDCNDLDAAIRPLAPGIDVLYDGIDADCDDRNDFDADGDGFMPPGFEVDYAAYVARYYTDDPIPFPVPPDRAFEDCLDQEDAGILVIPTGYPADPTTVHPAVVGFDNVDTAYDGVDADCNRDNDYDIDQDAFMPPGYTADFLAFVEAWGITPDELIAWAEVNPEAGLTEPGQGDCADDDGTRWPGALEVLGDGVDQDCDTLVDSSAFGFADLIWTHPTNPEVGRLDDQYLLLVGVESAVLDVAVVEAGVGIPFDLADARGGANPVGTYLNWKGNPATRLQGTIDAAPDPAPVDDDGDGILDPTLYVATTYVNDFQTWVFLSGVQYKSAADLLLPPMQTFDNLAVVYDASDVDLVFDDDGEPFTLACSPTQMHAIHTDASPALATNVATGADVCFFTGPPQVGGPTYEASFDRCLGGTCDSWTLDATPTLTQGGPIAESWQHGDYEMGWLLRIDPDGVATLTDTVNGTPDLAILPGRDVIHADVSEYNGILYVVALVDEATGPELILQYGTAAASTEQPLPFSHPTLPDVVPSSVAVHADADRVVIGVTALDPQDDADEDAVGWMFLAP